MYFFYFKDIIMFREFYHIVFLYTPNSFQAQKLFPNISYRKTLIKYQIPSNIKVHPGNNFKKPFGCAAVEVSGLRASHVFSNFSFYSTDEDNQADLSCRSGCPFQ